MFSSYAHFFLCPLAFHCLRLTYENSHRAEIVQLLFYLFIHSFSFLYPGGIITVVLCSLCFSSAVQKWRVASIRAAESWTCVGVKHWIKKWDSNSLLHVFLLALRSCRCQEKNTAQQLRDSRYTLKIWAFCVVKGS